MVVSIAMSVVKAVVFHTDRLMHSREPSMDRRPVAVFLNRIYSPSLDAQNSAVDSIYILLNLSRHELFAASHS
jgi:hypothetical protein